MAIRVRKLAKELARTPNDVLGILHAIGFTRFCTPNDMLSSQVVSRLQKAIRTGVVPVHFVAESVSSETPSSDNGRSKRQAYTENELEMDIHHWLKPSSQVTKEAEPESPRVTASKPVVSKIELSPDVQQERIKGLEAERDALRCQLDTLKREHAAVQQTLDEVSEKAEQRTENTQTTPMALILEKRGLRGSNEFGRALEGLASLRLENEWIHHVRVSEDELFLAYLQEKIVLVNDTSVVINRMGLAPVVVSPERAEQESDAVFATVVAAISESFLLFGLRRVLVVGGGALELRILREFADKRIQLQIVAPIVRTSQMAETDVHRHDAVILWGVDADDEAKEIYSSSKAEVLFLPQGSLQEFADSLRKALK